MKVDLTDKNAREYVTETLDLLLKALKEMIESDATMRKTYTYQTIAQVGKVILDGTKMLESHHVEADGQHYTSGMTSAQFLQYMKEKTRKRNENLPLARLEDVEVEIPLCGS